MLLDTCQRDVDLGQKCFGGPLVRTSVGMGAFFGQHVPSLFEVADDQTVNPVDRRAGLVALLDGGGGPVDIRQRAEDAHEVEVGERPQQPRFAFDPVVFGFRHAAAQSDVHQQVVDRIDRLVGSVVDVVGRAVVHRHVHRRQLDHVGRVAVLELHGGRMPRQEHVQVAAVAVALRNVAVTGVQDGLHAVRGGVDVLRTELGRRVFRQEVVAGGAQTRAAEDEKQDDYLFHGLFLFMRDTVRRSS